MEEKIVYDSSDIHQIFGLLNSIQIQGLQSIEAIHSVVAILNRGKIEGTQTSEGAAK